MNIINPLPIYCIALLPLIPFGYQFAFRICQLFIKGKLFQRIIAIPVFIACWLFIIIYSGLFSHSFIFGLISATVLTGIAGFVVELLFRKTKEPVEIDISKDKNQNSRMRMWLSALIGSIIIYYIGAYGNFHDETLVNGHKAIIAQLQNNFFPPRNLLNPADALRYHFGFNLICAALTALTRCSIDFAIDITTAASWFFCWISLWQLGEKLFSFKRSGEIVAVCTMLGGGLGPFIGLFVADRSWEERLTGILSVKSGMLLNPPLISYFFQHPFAAGLPLTIGILLLIAEESRQRYLLKNILLVIIFIALYFSQTVLFLTLLPAVAIYFIVVKKELKFAFTAGVIIILIIISRSGLLFTPVENSGSLNLEMHLWSSNASIIGIVAWYVGTFGFLLLFGVIGFFRLKNYRTIFVMIIIVSLLIPFFMRFRYSWDVVKFSTVAAIYLGILSGGAIAWMLQHNLKKSRVFATIGIVGVTTCAILNAGVFIYDEHFKTISYYNEHVSNLTGDYVSSINWFRKNANQDETILCDKKYSFDFVLYSGLPVVYDESSLRASAFGMPDERRIKYSELLLSDSINVKDFTKFGIRWVIVDVSDIKKIEELRMTGDFSEVQQFGALKIFRLN